jgi:hypothetical protein
LGNGGECIRHGYRPRINQLEEAVEVAGPFGIDLAPLGTAMKKARRKPWL